MRTLRHVVLVSIFAMSVPAFAGESKSSDVKPVAPAATATTSHARRGKKPVKSSTAEKAPAGGEAKTGEVKASDAKAPTPAPAATK